MSVSDIKVKYLKKKLKEGYIPEQVEVVCIATNRSVYINGVLSNYKQDSKTPVEPLYSTEVDWGTDRNASKETAYRILQRTFHPNRAVEMVPVFLDLVKSFPQGSCKMVVKLREWADTLVDAIEAGNEPLMPSQGRFAVDMGTGSVIKEVKAHVGYKN